MYAARGLYSLFFVCFISHTISHARCIHTILLFLIIKFFLLYIWFGLTNAMKLLVRWNPHVICHFIIVLYLNRMCSKHPHIMWYIERYTQNVCSFVNHLRLIALIQTSEPLNVDSKTTLRLLIPMPKMKVLQCRKFPFISLHYLFVSYIKFSVFVGHSIILFWCMQLHAMR